VQPFGSFDCPDWEVACESDRGNVWSRMIEKRRLCLESGENFAERLRAVLGTG
jgi:hypothetical protein